MRLDSQRSQPHSTTNGSSQNGSSPPTNGSARAEASNGTHTNGNGEGAIATVRSDEPFYGHDREEFTRILLQSLSDLGYRGAAEQLSIESGYELEVPSVAAFRSAVLSGRWDESEALLFGLEQADSEGGVSLGNGHAQLSRRTSRNGVDGSDDANGRHDGGSNNNNNNNNKGLPLQPSTDTTLLKFMLRRQKLLEMLERRDLTGALNVLRMELTPLKTDVPELHFLSSLLMCQSAEEIRRRADWDGAEGQSRVQLLSEISKSISPSVMIPEHRLADLLSSVQEQQIIDCRYHNTLVQPSLYTDHDCSIDDFPIHVLQEHTKHDDEVWFLEFSHDGTMLATAGKDGLVCVYDTERWRLKHEFREHRLGNTSVDGPGDRGICSVAFSPNDKYLISCCENKDFIVMNVRTGQRVAEARHFDYAVTAAAWLPDSKSFVIGSQSAQRPLALYSLPNSQSPYPRQLETEVHVWRDPPEGSRGQRAAGCQLRVADCAVNSTGTLLAAATLDNRIQIYSLDAKDGYCKLQDFVKEDKLTSVNFSKDGELLVSMNDGKVFTMDIDTGSEITRYDGAKQEQYVIRSAFGGANEGFVISGSEDGRVYIWRRPTHERIASLLAHHGSVNAVAWHPTNPAIFASAGDDRRVKIWTSRRQLEAAPSTGTLF